MTHFGRGFPVTSPLLTVYDGYCTGRPMAKPATHAGQAEKQGDRLIFKPPERNKDAILDVLKEVLPQSGRGLEIGAGSGQHTVHFAGYFSNLDWLATEPDPKLRRSIEAWIDHAGITNVMPPIDLDARSADWQIDQADAVLCINVIHIAPWDACVGVVEGAARVLSQNSALYFYGPFSINGVHTSPGNADFDETLKGRNPEFGVRDTSDVTALANKHGFDLERTIEMPANNLSVIYRKTAH